MSKAGKKPQPRHLSKKQVKTLFDSEKWRNTSELNDIVDVPVFTNEKGEIIFIYENGSGTFHPSGERVRQIDREATEAMNEPVQKPIEYYGKNFDFRNIKKELAGQINLVQIGKKFDRTQLEQLCAYADSIKGKPTWTPSIDLVRKVAAIICMFFEDVEGIKWKMQKMHEIFEPVIEANRGNFIGVHDSVWSYLTKKGRLIEQIEILSVVRKL